jgi:DNA-binding GntR family transcriptional regulator
MTPPGTFDRVYSTIRQRLRQGLYRPGERLEPALLSDELNASVTPVRDALHRLTGERLVEAPRHEGFRVPTMTETMLRHLYAWHLDLLLLAVMKRQAVALAEEAASSDDAGRPDRRNAMFLALVRSAGNPEHVAALESLSERLEPVQRLERDFLDETEAETNQILSARRLRIVPELLGRLLEG